MQKLSIGLILSILSAPVLAGFHMPYLEFEGVLKEAHRERFVPHSGSGKFDNWLAVNVPHGAASSLKALIEKRFQVQLQNRNESHITVLTPPEFWSLQKFLTMEEIHAAVSKGIQNSRYDVVCLGRGTAMQDGKVEQTFFVVVRSADLLAIREKLQKLLEKKSAPPDTFHPLEFYPHITVGFTKSDIHLEQGVIKDARSCVANLRERP